MTVEVKRVGSFVSAPDDGRLKVSLSVIPGKQQQSWLMAKSDEEGVILGLFKRQPRGELQIHEPV